MASVFHARMSFFDVTPLGRILQRFSKDTDVLDNQLPGSWNMTTEFITGLGTQLATMASIEPLLIVFLAPIGALYFHFQAFFRASYREIKRLDATTASPVYAHFSETLAGLSTIRAFGHQGRFVGENVARVGVNQRAFYAQRCACDRWLPVRLETVGNGIVLVVALLGVASRGTKMAAFSGLVLSFSLDITGLLSWVIRQWSETESQMVSVERVTEYAALPSEEESGGAAMRHGSASEAPAGWPRAGALRFDRVSLRYQPSMPLVLRSVTFDVAPSQKVGLVGRTGSGKSTTLTALWRLVELESGAIWLDGVDTSRLELKTLRSAITCIPQDPVLFSGSVRHNLDPAGAAAHSDAELWRVLDAARLRDALAGKGLDAPVAEFGENFSAGQRQLLCLSRALLRGTRVVCLDEATGLRPRPCAARVSRQPARLTPDARHAHRQHRSTWRRTR